MSSIVYNKSKTYLLPLLSELIAFEDKFLPYLENTYMFDDENEFKECFYILHDFSFRNPEFTSYEHRLTNNKLFVKHIDIGNKVLYIFKFPEEYLHEYYCLRDSKYSKFGKDAKELILDYWTKMYGKSSAGINFILKVKQILFKEDKLKKEIEDRLSTKDNGIVILDDDAELGEFVKVENETFNLKQFKKVEGKS